MGYVARVPTNVNELYDSLKKIYENKSHVKSYRVNESTSHLEVDLDWTAHHLGGEAGKDFFLPLKRAKQREALALIHKLMVGDHAPSQSEAQELYDMIDPQNR